MKSKRTPALLLSLLLALPAAAEAGQDGAKTDETGEETSAEGGGAGALDAAHTGAFHFGSYGRVVVASDLRQGGARDDDLVTWGPRVDEGTYAELELRREDRFSEMRTRVVATLALAGPLFHYDGRFATSVAVRNLYAEAKGVLDPKLSMWAGSRMVRGDDVYLLDFWPLDELNLVGLGVSDTPRPGFRLHVSAGLARPSDPFFSQNVEVPASTGFGTEEIALLDRPRLAVAARGEWGPGVAADAGLKAVLYGELHALPAGTRLLDTGALQALPAEGGFVLGAQLGAFSVPHHAFVNLFLRVASGLGAYGLLDPVGSDPLLVTSTGKAKEVRLALSSNWEHGRFAVQTGAYYRYVHDPVDAAYDGSVRSEGVVAVRPHVWFGDHLAVALEGSFQGLETNRLDDRTGAPVGGTAWKVAVMPYLSPAGRGSFTRPQLRLIYAVTFRDQGARRLLPDADTRSARADEHFLGVGAEWWFDASSYGAE